MRKKSGKCTLDSSLHYYFFPFLELALDGHYVQSRRCKCRLRDTSEEFAGLLRRMIVLIFCPEFYCTILDLLPVIPCLIISDKSTTASF